MRSGFTLIELVLVVGLIAIIATATMSIGSSWYNLNNFDNAFNMTLSSLRKAQAYAIDNKNDAIWGVCLTSRTIRLFSGSCASPTISNDYNLPDNAVISGLSTVTFSQYRGEPSVPQTIILTVADKSKTISINLLGGFEIN